MIFSGWILPDLYEVKCSSCSTSNGHIEIVKRYLARLKFQDATTYHKIMLKINEAKKIFPSFDLGDFAVVYLGWIKINNAPMNILFYARDHELEFIIKKYINYGYVSVILERVSSSFISCPPSNKII